MPATLSAPRTRPKPRWQHGESTFTLAESGPDFGRFLKRQSLGLVRVVTDDAEIIGFLLRDDEAGQLRVGHCVGFMRDEWQIERRQKWRVSAIGRERITETRRLD